MSTLNVIDISGWQAGINLAIVPTDCVGIKATGGKGFVSPVCDTQYQQAKKLGKGRLIYHFAHEEGFEGTAAEEAAWFLSQTKGYHGDAIICLDWEGDNVHDVVWAKTWLDLVYKATGVKPMIYMNQYAENSYDWRAVVAAGYGLWIAQYPSSDGQGWGPLGNPPKLVHWPFAAMWQYTATGRILGWKDNLDLNVFYGDRNAWNKYAAKAGAKPVTPAPVKPAHKPPVKPVPVPVTPSTYRVVANDYLILIGQKTGVPWQTIARLNGLRDPYVIYPGQILKLR